MEKLETPSTDRPVDRLARWAPLASAADAWQSVVKKVLESAGPAVVDALHGTPLGHPLHPLLTDVPVGAWTVTAVLDALELAGKDDLAAGADASLAIGIGGAVLAATAGWADWSDADGEAKSLGLAHAGLNAVALGAYAAALLLRRNGNRETGIALGMIGYAFVSAAGYLGGELSFGRGVGVRQTGEPVTPPTDFVTVLDAGELAEGAMHRVEAQGVPVLLYREGETISALSAVCTHAGGPLDEGSVKDGCVTCPWHGSTFRFSDGAAVHGPAVFPVSRYEARIVQGKIQVRALAG
jgi:nitrite reductase/ring-hydroxylating ferredoxin subunit/uncharacterized membrane protein